MRLEGKMGARGSGSSRSAAEPKEAGMISRIAVGDRHAFEMLYRSYFPRLTRFLDRMTRSAQLIEEIVNDTMLVVWQKSRTYPPRTGLGHPEACLRIWQPSWQSVHQ